jgi:Cu(I)/Ag(I) efflux system membrane protein CusA/SilA
LVERIIAWSLRHRAIVLLCAAAIALLGTLSIPELSLDAIPDLSEIQVIVQTNYPGQSPQLVEDQVSYPLASALLGAFARAGVLGADGFSAAARR